MFGNITVEQRGSAPRFERWGEERWNAAAFRRSAHSDTAESTRARRLCSGRMAPRGFPSTGYAVRFVDAGFRKRASAPANIHPAQIVVVTEHQSRLARPQIGKIGSASCRERVCQNG